MPSPTRSDSAGPMPASSSRPTEMRAELSRSVKLRRAVGAFVVDNFFQGSSRLARLHPDSKPDRHGVEIVRDVAYGRQGKREHLLDVYLPRTHKEPRPVILYVH